MGCLCALACERLIASLAHPRHILQARSDMGVYLRSALFIAPIQMQWRILPLIISFDPKYGLTNSCASADDLIRASASDVLRERLPPSTGLLPLVIRGYSEIGFVDAVT